jgi:MFS family permease
MLSLTHSPLALGFGVALRYVPVLLFTPYAGVIVDRHDRRRTLILTQSSLAVVSLALGTVILVGAVNVWWVYACALAFGFVSAVDNPARMALIPELVEPTELHSAITLNSILANVGRGVGPVVSAALIATIGIGWCFLANAVSFAAVIGSLLAMRVSRIKSEGRIAPGRGQLRTALGLARRNPQILGPLAMMAIVGTLTFEFEVSLPVFAEISLKAGPTEYAFLTTGFGAGAVVAGLFLLFWPQTGAHRMVAIVFGYAIAVAATAVSPNPPTADLFVVFVGGCSIAFLTTGNSTIQLAAPPGMRGRITSLWTTAFIGSTPIGSLVIGSAGQTWGGRAALGLGAAACVIAGVVAILILRALRPPGDTDVADGLAKAAGSAPRF